jgi:hypothetical protein
MNPRDLDRMVKGSEEMEVICIIRPVNQPKAGSRVVIINRASRKFMAYLTGESKDQPLTTVDSSHENAASIESASTDDRTDPPARDRRVTDNSARTTWKPSTAWRQIPVSVAAAQPYSHFSTVTDDSGATGAQPSATLASSAADSQSTNIAATAQTDSWRWVRSGR